MFLECCSDFGSGNVLRLVSVERFAREKLCKVLEGIVFPVAVILHERCFLENGAGEGLQGILSKCSLAVFVVKQLHDLIHWAIDRLDYVQKTVGLQHAFHF